MTARRASTAGTRPLERSSQKDALLDDLDAETVEDLDVDEDAEDIRGGTTRTCPTSH